MIRPLDAKLERKKPIQKKKKNHPRNNCLGQISTTNMYARECKRQFSWQQFPSKATLIRRNWLEFQLKTSPKHSETPRRKNGDIPESDSGRSKFKFRSTDTIAILIQRLVCKNSTSPSIKYGLRNVISTVI